MSEESSKSPEHGRKTVKEYLRKKPGEDGRNKSPTKKEVMEHYAEVEKPTEYIQIDGWSKVEPGDPHIHPDEDGDCIIRGTSFELWRGGYTVRVHIRKGGSSAEAIKVLTKMIKSLRKGV